MKQAQLETTAAQIETTAGHNSWTACRWFKDKLACVHLNWEYQVSQACPHLLALADAEVAVESLSLYLRPAVEPRLCAYRISLDSSTAVGALVLALLTGIDLFRPTQCLQYHTSAHM